MNFVERGPLRYFQRVARGIHAHLGEAKLSFTQDIVQIVVEGEKGLSVVVSPEAVEWRLPTIEWAGPHSPLASSKLWKRIPMDEHPPPESHGFADYVQIQRNLALQAREAEFRPCRFCGANFPPEHMTEDSCHSCASEHLGIVY